MCSCDPCRARYQRPDTESSAYDTLRVNAGRVRGSGSGFEEDLRGRLITSITPSPSPNAPHPFLNLWAMERGQGVRKRNERGLRAITAVRGCDGDGDQ